MKNNYLLLLFLFTVTTLSAQINLEEGLVAYYDFADHLNDQSPFQNDAYANSGISFVDDFENKSNEAIYFDGSGTGSYVAVRNAPQLNFNPGEIFSISLWLKVPLTQNSTEGGVNDIISKWANAGNQPYAYTLRIYNQSEPEANGRIAVGIFETYSSSCPVNALGMVGTVPINDDRWHHIVFTRTENRLLQLYIDCTLAAEVADNTTCGLTNDANLTLGVRHLANTFRRAFTGSMDELRFYNRTLSEEERQLLCEGETSTENSSYNCSLAPNPLRSGEKLYLFHEDTRAASATFTVYSAAGKYVTTIQQGETLTLPAGLYLVGTCATDKEQVLKKLVVIN